MPYCHPTPEEIDSILEKVVACTVTKEEHDSLSNFKHLDGWERYQAAGITVIDCETGDVLDFTVPC
jgi:hypothetical protein